jgi:MHS family proline/betaine transporter-like MFS transporter
MEEYFMNTRNLFQKKTSTKAILASTIGTTLEFYDFALFGFLAPIFSIYFFPSQNPFFSTLYGYTAFLIGYLFKPVGAVLWGQIGDKRGRRVALCSSLYFMGFSTLLIGILPTYARIGILAPLLLLLARIIQGLSQGGELAGGLLFALEHTPAKHKGFAGGIFNGICTSGILLGSLAGYLCTLSRAPIWAWRIPFLLGFCVVLLGVYIRHNTTETPIFESIKKEEIPKLPLYHGIKTEYQQFIGMLFITGLPAVAFHMNFIYLPMYFKELPGITEQLARLSSTIGLSYLILLLPIFGYLSDKFGQATIMKLGASLIFVWSLFLFAQLDSFSANKLWAGYFIFATGLAMFNGPWCTFASEIFHKKHRYSCIGTANTIGGALFGGTAPLVGALLLKLEHGLTFLSIYIALWGILGYFSVNKLQHLQIQNYKINWEKRSHEYNAEFS